MAYIIVRLCRDCVDTGCVAVCPVDCIYRYQGSDTAQFPNQLYIHPDECIDCGACEPECPVNAIFPEESLPVEWSPYTKMDAVWFTDKGAARELVEEAKPAG